MGHKSAVTASKLEKLLEQSKECAHFSQEQKDWIRCSFTGAYMPAYFANDPRLNTVLHLEVHELMRVLASADAASANILSLAAMGHDGILEPNASRHGPIYFAQLLMHYSANFYLPLRQRDLPSLLKCGRLFNCLI